MKKVFLVFFECCFSLMCMATSYYVSESGNDANTGKSPSLPWKTLTKVNATKFRAGDQILFQRGSVFYGTLIVSQSGTYANPIIYSAYGTGPNPLITGFSAVTEWISKGKGIWESSKAVSPLSVCNMLVVNGINTPMGKYPNENAPKMGYIFITSHSGKTSLTYSGFPADFTGGEVVVRNQYRLDRRTIQSQSNATLNLENSVSMEDGQPFFIQNHINTLDQQNEWYFNSTTKKISIYSKIRPVNVKVATIDKLVTLSNAVKYITIDGISFSGANQNAIYRWPHGSKAEKVNYVTIRNCNLSFTGDDALSVKIDHLILENNTISDSNGSGIAADNSKHVVIRNNNISNISIYKGMSQGWGATSAIKICAAVKALVEYNKIANCGYNGINFSYKGTEDVTIQYNYIDSFCTVLSDGGGIYGNRNARILYNIITNGGPNVIKIGKLDPWAVGIYLDDDSFNNYVYGNTVAHCNRVGIYLHNTRSSGIHYNTCFNNRTWQLTSVDNPGNNGWVAKDTIVHNIFVSKSTNYQTVHYNWGNGADTTLGVIHHNYYCRPAKEGSEIHSNKKSYTLSEWKSLTGKDTGSSGSYKTVSSDNDLIFYINPAKTIRTIKLSQPMTDVTGKKYSNKIELQPYTSIILIKTLK